MPTLLLYGSYGFVGSLIANEAIDRGLDPILAGRDRETLREQVDDLEQPGRRFSLDDPDTVAEALEDVDCVLNCAGPFSNTADPLVEGCLESGTDYVDITGEIPVIESIEDRDAAAEGAGVTLLPSAALSTVPMDCLAAHLHERLPEATDLALGVDSFRVPSIGTVRTVIEGAEDGGTIRRDGHLENVPTAWRTREIDFGRGERPAITMPMGDVSTAHYTTGIPNVEMYAVMPQPARTALKLHRYLAPVLAVKPVQQVLKLLAGVREGPSERARERGSAYIWGEATADDGERVVSRLRTPDPYIVTTDAAVTVTERVLAGETDSGFQTPAGAFGTELVFELEGVEGFFDESTPEETSPVSPLLQ
ncbi:saccharopine dehydrogenase [Natronorubrum sp. JWXQ-INN-674]|uniref:Saccharopine dehydrogenase n=1 Tax=Natronorubrum halalkaliphilum TaxID=2691917 RepID=A0A6B0VN37_9EURY|nr:saccharopine dehydrogenase NADP-binding domain-containing protein [Natronorubrum halalkaliphilum]MXV62605.1 saccharopine dehydrogenase [Natronorubrum halalkaliphilum]